MDEGYNHFNFKGGGEAIKVARQLLRDLDDRLAERKAGLPGVGTAEELGAIRREVADFEADPSRTRPATPERQRHTLTSRRIVRAWPPTDTVRTGVEALNDLLQRPLP